MDFSMHFFYRLDDELVNHNFFIERRLYQTSRIHMIKGHNSRKQFYKISYNEGTLNVIIMKRYWMVYRIIAAIKVRNESLLSIDATIKDILKTINTISQLNESLTDKLP